MLRTLRVGAVLLALPWALACAENVKPNPDGLPPHKIEDLHYGDVLFYFYQDDYFAAITRLLAAQELQRVPHTESEAELLLGGLYLSLGEHVEAGRIFDALLAANSTEAVRNRAWYFLGKVWYQRGYLEESERALKQVSDTIEPRINAERIMLLAQLMMREGRFDDAIAVLHTWRGSPGWTAYAQFNLGIALVRTDRLDDAVPFLDAVGRLQSRSEEFLSLKDKANLALGFAFLQAKRAAEAQPILERVRVEGPYSSKALLGVGWAYANLGNFKRALVPWMALHKRNMLDAAVQESFLAVPYAFSELHADGQAAEYYSSAITSFDSEVQRINASIEVIQSGNLLERLLGDDKQAKVSWYWQLKDVPHAPESQYLYQLLASNDFQEGLKNYRELQYLRRNLEDWRENLNTYDDIVDTKRKAYAERLPKADAVMASTDLDGLAHKRVEFESRLNEIERSNDLIALGTPEERATWLRLKRIEDYLAAHPDDRDLDDMRDKQRLMKGVVYWHLAESFKARVWNERRSVKELAASLKETQKRAVLVGQARTSVPVDNGGFAARLAQVHERMDQLQARLADVSERQNRYLQALAIEQLEGQKQRIATYQIQARYALATIYDRATSDKPKASP
jgi:lipopolysaccharide biosynthesis regulator YciM